MFGLGGGELLVILLFAFLIFGPDKLPEVGKSVGRAVRKLRSLTDEVSDAVEENVYKPIKQAMEEGEREETVVATASSAASAPKVQGAAATAGATGAGGSESVPTVPAPRESFAQRKARLEQEAAQREAAQREAAQSTAQGSTQREDAGQGVDR